MGEIIKNLLNWHKKNYRPYPWRNVSSPYMVMIAEFMLQRTRADQVVPVYNQFLKKYPDVDQLAEADIEDIKATLKPLGLYWRANHFKMAAEYIQRTFSGNIPDNKEDLKNIPGVGDYAAGAILAVAFRKKSCIVDSNIARVLNRYYGLGLNGEIRRKKEIVELACQLFNHKEPNKILFAIIDFSAIVCTPVNPKHGICPLKNNCLYYKNLEK
ncbi:DNA glycosylase [Methanocella arvoryzae]|uniref:Adenine DNA glycosylase n=1 Tax=Methanocella arvoryzae (strain DSM 22066 / NBRC 105507 / MRE50) TaxID=351160 RepID=Q0W1Z4_METAR|nr:DNA glycosylase [Methanocella arvoryzae]CAJ37599.1 putative DNA glycosylase [Methanocella arvoryzae MRE50]